MSNVPVPSSPTRSAADVLESALRALDATDNEVKVALTALAAEIRQTSLDLANYVQTNELEQRREVPHGSINLSKKVRRASGAFRT